MSDQCSGGSIYDRAVHTVTKSKVRSTLGQQKSPTFDKVDRVELSTMSTATRSTVNFRQYGNKSATQSKVDVVANLSTFYLSPVFTDPNYCTLHIPPTACVRTHYILLFVALVIIVSTISAACRVICCSAVGSQGSIN